MKKLLTKTLLAVSLLGFGFVFASSNASDYAGLPSELSGLPSELAGLPSELAGLPSEHSTIKLMGLPSEH